MSDYTALEDKILATLNADGVIPTVFAEMHSGDGSIERDLENNGYMFSPEQTPALYIKCDEAARTQETVSTGKRKAYTYPVRIYIVNSQSTKDDCRSNLHYLADLIEKLLRKQVDSATDLSGHGGIVTECGLETLTIQNAGDVWQGFAIVKINVYIIQYIG